MWEQNTVNPVNMDTKRVIEYIYPYQRGVRIKYKRVEFRENVRAFFPNGQSKLFAIMRLSRCL